LALVTGNDHDSYLLTREIRQALTARRRTPQYQFEYAPQSQALPSLVSACVATNPDCIVVVADPSLSAQLVLALRAAGYAGSIVGGPACGRSPFISQVADQAGELTFPVLCGPCTGSVLAAPDAGETGWLDRSDYAGRHTYDAVWLVVRAIRQAGLNRADIAQALRTLSPTAGVSGPIEWDGPGSNVRRPQLAGLRDGHIVRLDGRPE
ncbi:MAG: ABC transporter substrate-binding protein, partial [Pirellulaceae bacterium]|nr:ABC transporter substrate-binding protein [Pirellulaceae bacterium]